MARSRDDALMRTFSGGEGGVTSAPRTWVQLLAVDSQLSYDDVPDYSRWMRKDPGAAPLTAGFRWAAVGLFLTSLPVLALAAAGMTGKPLSAWLPWVASSLAAGLWAFHETPGRVRVTPSGFVTLAALATAGLPLAVLSAVVTAVASWAVSLQSGRRLHGHTLAVNSAVLVLAAGAASAVFDTVLGVPGGAHLTDKLTSDRFLLAFPAAALTYVGINTGLTAVSLAARTARPMVAVWGQLFSGIGLFFTLGMLQSLAFIIAFGNWGLPGPEGAGTAIAFVIVSLLLGAGRQAVYQQEARSHVQCIAGLLHSATRPENRKYPLALVLLEDLLAQGTRRFLATIPPEELTFEAEEAVLGAEIAWKLGASRESIRSFLTAHENPAGSGPFGLKELPLPAWSPAFSDRMNRDTSEAMDDEPEWMVPVFSRLAAVTRPAEELMDDEDRKWSRLALSGARTVHSLLERYDYGRRLSTPEDLEWWRSCEISGFGPAESRLLPAEDAEPSVS
jgi:hypothetical protein